MDICAESSTQRTCLRITNAEPWVSRIPALTPVPTRTYAEATGRPIPTVVKDENGDGNNDEDSVMETILDQLLLREGTRKRTKTKS